LPLNLPNLDDLSWDDLMKEGRSLIPAWAPEWTNHNPSDPGITLVELFAYFSEKCLRILEVDQRAWMENARAGISIE
jgi:hypothetical protein